MNFRLSRNATAKIKDKTNWHRIEMLDMPKPCIKCNWICKYVEKRVNRKILVIVWVMNMRDSTKDNKELNLNKALCQREETRPYLIFQCTASL